MWCITGSAEAQRLPREALQSADSLSIVTCRRKEYLTSTGDVAGEEKVGLSRRRMASYHHCEDDEARQAGERTHVQACSTHYGLGWLRQVGDRHGQGAEKKEKKEKKKKKVQHVF